MKTSVNQITVNKVRSIEAIKTIHNHIKSLNHKLHECNFSIKEESTGIVWENFGGFNNNPWDLWLRKQGTRGCQSRTFIRMSVGKHLDHAIDFAKRIEGFQEK